MRWIGAVSTLFWIAAVASSQSLVAGQTVRLGSSRYIDLNGDYALNADGSMWLPGRIVVRIGNEQFEETARKIREALRASGFDTFDLTIQLGPRRSRRISFAGAVAVAGNVNYRNGMRLIEILALASPTVGADLDAVQITDAEGVVTRHRVDSASGSGAIWNVALRPGDSVFVPLSEGAADIGVLGEVASPGRYEYYPGITALKAIGLAGGASGNADLSSIEVVRKGEIVQKVNGVLNYDIELRRGDLVRVAIKANPQYVYVTGVVFKPGRFAFRAGMNLTDALLLAEGMNPLLGPYEVFLVRRVSGSNKRTRVDLDRIARRLDPNPILEPSDTVDVLPRRKGGEASFP